MDCVICHGPASAIFLCRIGTFATGGGLMMVKGVCFATLQLRLVMQIGGFNVTAWKDELTGSRLMDVWMNVGEELPIGRCCSKSWKILKV